ncbi:hypothetical protein IAR55_001815 [Kwoniella newhampshirensis]|uniref:Pod-specific dehydrogenase n=1 Tax=Kwoniella newhampshirensis TaxID=1651941 RepID=A0AAW0Z388_9TREE
MEYLLTIWAWIRHKVDTAIHSGIPLVFWVRPWWSADQMPDQTGKTIFVTGGNSGTGYSTCLAFYNAGATVYLACRNESKAQKAMEEIKKGGEINFWGFSYPKRSQEQRDRRKGRLEYICLDLTDLESVDKCADAFLRKEKKLDILFANAGIMATPEGQFTKQGYTLQFGTNVLGHHRLISLLLPLLLSSPPTNPSRVIISSSAGHSMAPTGGVNYQSVIRDPSHPKDLDKPRQGKHELNKWDEYAQSKWGDIALAKWLNYQHGDQGRLISIAVHPALAATNLADSLGFAAPLKDIPWLVALITFPAKVGALNQIWAATLALPDAWYLNGEYIVPFQKIGVARPDLNDRKKVEELWSWCDEQAKKWV